MVKKSTPASTLASTLQTITDAAPGLRAAGVTRVVVGDVIARLSAPPAPKEKAEAAEREVDLTDLGDFRGKAGAP